jgi:phosphatidylglycerol lysyltransferase
VTPQPQPGTHKRAEAAGVPEPDPGASPIRHPSPLKEFIALATLGSGLVNLYSVLGPPLPEREAILHSVFPLEFLHLSRFITLLIGFALVVLSFNVYKRKKRAFIPVAFLACLSIAFHLTKGLDYEEAVFSLVLLVALLFGRTRFTVQSSVPDFRDAASRFGLGIALTIAYGIVGFWVLDRRQFGADFNLHQALQNTISLLLFAPEPQLVPHTMYARWFLQSFYVISATAIVYGTVMLFRPVLYRYRTQPHEHVLALHLVSTYGRTALDNFKCWPDKSYFFTKDQNAFVTYKVAGAVAVALGDPTGPPGQIHRVTVGLPGNRKSFTRRKSGSLFLSADELHLQL